METYKISSNVRALVSDTISANSGVHRGAATLIESEIDHKFLYLASRHHIYELILKVVWESLFGQSISPNNRLFMKFQQQWNTIDTSLPTNSISIPKGFEKKRSDVILEVRNLLSNKDHFPRDDYRELAELTLLLLGEIPPRGVHWLKPGAFHLALWMANALYAAGKLFAFPNNLTWMIRL